MAQLSLLQNNTSAPPPRRATQGYDTPHRHRPREAEPYDDEEKEGGGGDDDDGEKEADRGGEGEGTAAQNREEASPATSVVSPRKTSGIKSSAFFDKGGDGQEREEGHRR